MTGENALLFAFSPDEVLALRVAVMHHLHECHHQIRVKAKSTPHHGVDVGDLEIANRFEALLDKLTL